MPQVPNAASQGQAILAYLTHMFGPDQARAMLAGFDGHQSAGGQGPGAGNVGPVNGYITDPTQTQPNPPRIDSSVTAPPPGAGSSGYDPLTSIQPPDTPGGPPRPAAATYNVGGGVGGGDPRSVDAAVNQMTGMAPGTVNPGYRPPGITPGPMAPRPNPAAVGGQNLNGVTAIPSNLTTNPNYIPIQYGGGGGMAGRNAPIMTARNFGDPATQARTAAMFAPRGFGFQPGGPTGGTQGAPQGGGPAVRGPMAYGPQLPSTPWQGPSAAQQATRYGWPFNMLGAVNPSS